MTCKDLQEEELEVLRAIYDGDVNFKELSSTSFQYMVGVNGDPKSFLLEISWDESYPEVAPSLSLDAFYNKQIIPEVKCTILTRLVEEATLQLGTPMTYTLVEYAKEKVEELTEGQPEKPTPTETVPNSEKSFPDSQLMAVSKKEKKPKLSKQQKRKLADKLDCRGERPRGWNWVDVVKHLSQCGPKINSNDSNGNS